MANEIFGFMGPDLKPMTFGPLPDQPLVSVLITNYNYGKYIGEAIESILAQTYTHFEVIVCDDGSTDNSCEVIDRYCVADKRVRLLRQANGGQGAAMNTAFSAANGDVIAMLDGDDMALERRLELVVRMLHQRPEAGMVVHALRIFSEKGKLGSWYPAEPLDEGWLAHTLLRGPEPLFPPCSGLALRVEVARRIFPLPWRDISHARCWDGPLREAAAFLAPVAALNETAGLYRLHPNSLLGFSSLITLQQLEIRLDELSGAIETRRIYSRAFLGVEPDEIVCNTLVGPLVLSRAALTGERLSFDQIARYSHGKLRLIWTALFLLPPWLTRRVCIWARESQIAAKGRWLKGSVYRFLGGLARLLGMRWKPKRRVHQSRFPYLQNG